MIECKASFDLSGFPAFVSERAETSAATARRQLETELQNVIEDLQDALMTLIGVEKVALEKLHSLQEHLESPDTEISEDIEEALLASLDGLMGMAKEDFHKVWDAGNPTLVKHLSDVLHVGWHSSRELFDAVEEARWTVMNSVEGLSEKSSTHDSVEDLLASLAS